MLEPTNNNLSKYINLVPRDWKSNSRIYGEACELWVSENISCPSCHSGTLIKLEANEPTIDHRCDDCGEAIQVKAKNGNFLKKDGSVSIVGAAYEKTLESLSSDNQWSMLLVSYNSGSESFVTEAHYIPSENVGPENVVPRKPLGPHCRRAGWQGCNLTFQGSDIHTICNFSDNR